MKTLWVNAVGRTLLTALILISPAAFEAGANKGGGKASAADGQKVFQANCAMCHLADDTKPKFGPGLKGLFKNKDLPTSHKATSDAAVLEQIEKGNPNAKPMPMPAFKDKLTPAQLKNLLEYLKTL